VNRLMMNIRKFGQRIYLCLDAIQYKHKFIGHDVNRCD
jgi:hypothetical protein